MSTLERGDLDETEIDAFINERWLITVRKDDGFSMDPVLQRWDRSPDLAGTGSASCSTVCSTSVVDSYFDAVQSFDEFYDRVSEGIFADRPARPAQQRHWFDMRRAMVRFHRLVVPMREAISALMRREHTAVAEALYPYYQDVYDHILRVTESSDSLRDLVEHHRRDQSQPPRLPPEPDREEGQQLGGHHRRPALITGYYGMNVPYPGFARVWGAVVSTALIVGGTIGLYGLFRRIDWL